MPIFKMNPSTHVKRLRHHGETLPIIQNESKLKLLNLQKSHKNPIPPLRSSFGIKTILNNSYFSHCRLRKQLTRTEIPANDELLLSRTTTELCRQFLTPSEHSHRERHCTEPYSRHPQRPSACRSVSPRSSPATAGTSLTPTTRTPNAFTLSSRRTD
jgi:hypothetical protein